VAASAWSVSTRISRPTPANHLRTNRLKIAVSDVGGRGAWGNLRNDGADGMVESFALCRCGITRYVDHERPATSGGKSSRFAPKLHTDALVMRSRRRRQHHRTHPRVRQRCRPTTGKNMSTVKNRLAFQALRTETRGSTRRAVAGVVTQMENPDSTRMQIYHRDVELISTFGRDRRRSDVHVWYGRRGDIQSAESDDTDDFTVRRLARRREIMTPPDHVDWVCGWGRPRGASLSIRFTSPDTLGTGGGLRRGTMSEWAADWNGLGPFWHCNSMHQETVEAFVPRPIRDPRRRCSGQI